MILLWGLANDPPLRAVRDALGNLCRETVFLDQRHAGSSQIDLELDEAVRGTVISGHVQIDLTRLTAVYLRPYDVTRLPDIKQAGPSSQLWRNATCFDGAMLRWADVTPAFVVNRPSSMAANNSKPYQLQQIRNFFRTPETLITTDANAARQFWETYKTVIYKSLSGTRSIVARLTEAHTARLKDLETCPTQFQNFIPGIDYRVHVVGREVFAAKIHSNADDYRYPRDGAERTSMAPYLLPQPVEQRCRELAHALSLPVTGLDLRQSPDGSWFCFEANPCPAFTSFAQNLTTQIASAVASLLIRSGASTPDTPT